MKLRIAIAAVLLILSPLACRDALAAEPNAERALAHVDAIQHQVEVGKKQVADLNANLHVARVANTELVKDRDGWRVRYDVLWNSVEMWIGWIIWNGFKWWLIAVVVIFVARMIFVYVGGPIGAAGAQVTTFLLGVLTCFITYLAAIPDNLYFRGEIERLKAENGGTL